MPNIRDFVSKKNIVPLHSEIGDVHRLAADVDYFFAKLNKLKQVYRARMLCKLHSEKEEGRPLPPPSPVGREPEGDKIKLKIKSRKPLVISNIRSYEQNKTNANV